MFKPVIRWNWKINCFWIAVRRYGALHHFAFISNMITHKTTKWITYCTPVRLDCVLTLLSFTWSDIVSLNTLHCKSYTNDDFVIINYTSLVFTSLNANLYANFSVGCFLGSFWIKLQRTGPEHKARIKIAYSKDITWNVSGFLSNISVPESSFPTKRSIFST